MVATSHVVATQIAVDVLREGGGAVDAAIAAAAALGVVEPAMTGIGGDCFVLYAPRGGNPLALNGSGHAGAAIQPGWFHERGLSAIADDSPHAITVPGAVDAWCRLHADHGRMDLARLLEPAARLAEDGYIVTPRVALDWAANTARLARHEETAAAFLPDGASPRPGDRHRLPALAATLRAIGRDGRAAFYEGAAAERMAAFLRAGGSVLTPDDFASYRCRYETPLSAAFEGHQVVECPPNGQGVIALALLRVLDGWQALDGAAPADHIHLFAEATKHAYAMRDALLGDPLHVPVPVDRLLGDAWRDAVRAAIDPARAVPGVPLPRPLNSDTVCFSVVDRDGNVVSFINSIFLAFGSTRFEAGTGVLFHCRGMAFRLDPRHPNAIGPRRRPLHTIIPGLAMKDGLAALSFGVMGGQYQAAGHAHLLLEYLARGRDLQEAVDLPRHFAYEDALTLETPIGAAVAETLAARGHRITRPALPLGGAQAIAIDRARGILIGASDGRKDGCVLAL